MFVSLPQQGIKQNLFTIDKSFTDTENKIVNVRFPEKSFQPVSFSYFHYIIFLQLNGFLVLFPSLWYFFFPFPFNRLFLLDWVGAETMLPKTLNSSRVLKWKWVTYSLLLRGISCLLFQKKKKKEKKRKEFNGSCTSIVSPLKNCFILWNKIEIFETYLLV